MKHVDVCVCVCVLVVRAECTKLVGGKCGLRIAARNAEATLCRKQLVGVLKLSGPVERKFPAKCSAMFGESRWTVPPLVANVSPLCCCTAFEGLGKCTSCTILDLKSFNFQAGPAEVYFVGTCKPDC